MSNVIKIKKGLNIKLVGKSEKVVVDADPSRFFAVKPPDFVGLTPKLSVKPEHKVKMGSALFFDKYRPDILFTSPVSGTVKEVRRGDRRKILEVIVEADSEQEYESFDKGNPKDMDADKIRENILKSGFWPGIIQRPYGVIANPEDEPRDIFVSCFDSAPLGPDYDLTLKDDEEAFKTGIAALKKLTKGKVHLGLQAGLPVARQFADIDDVEYHFFSGPHPAGNVGIQIHHVAPVNKGEILWTVNPLHVMLIGRVFLKGQVNPEIICSLAGSHVEKPRYYRTRMGASVDTILKGNLVDAGLPSRIISGNVLTGTQIAEDGYLGFYDNLISVIPEGKYYELFGWATPGLKKFSNTRAFFSWLRPNKEWNIDTNLKGGPRAFVMTGEYEKVLPMDILTVQLLKSILVEDIDKMEELGIYEVIEEDLALCEFVCTSKTDVQDILRQGLDLLRKELS